MYESVDEGDADIFESAFVVVKDELIEEADGLPKSWVKHVLDAILWSP